MCSRILSEEADKRHPLAAHCHSRISSRNPLAGNVTAARRVNSRIRRIPPKPACAGAAGRSAAARQAPCADHAGPSPATCRLPPAGGRPARAAPSATRHAPASGRRIGFRSFRSRRGLPCRPASVRAKPGPRPHARRIGTACPANTRRKKAGGNRSRRLQKQKKGTSEKSPYLLVELGRIELPTS